jgi:hypothetical protein
VASASACASGDLPARSASIFDASATLSDVMPKGFRSGRARKFNRRQHMGR